MLPTSKYCLTVVILIILFSPFYEAKAQNIDCAYPILFLHGYTGNQESFEDVYTDANFVACFGDLSDTYHAVLNATSNTNIWGADGESGTSDDDVLISFDNETNELASGCIYAMNFNNFWNENESNPEIDINGCSSPGLFESDSNESAITKGGYALGKAIEKILAANPGKDKVILVGHSMGGLTSREYLQRTVDNDNISDPRWWVDPALDDGHKVLKLVTTSTPHRGSNFFGDTGFTDHEAADDRDGTPDLFAEATRDLRYTYGCGFLNLFSCPAPYLWGGSEEEVTATFWNDDIDADGDENSIIVGINEAGSPDEWDGTKDNPSMPLPNNIRYTWITSDTPLNSGDGVVSWERQWLFNGSTPEPSDAVAFRLTDTLLTDYSHLNVNTDPNVIIRGLDEGDYPSFAWKVSLDNLMGGIVQVRSEDVPEGDNHSDPDWFMVEIPAEAEGDLNLTFNPHPALSGQIDFFNTTPGDFDEMTVNGNHQVLFNAGDPTISMLIPDTDYTPGSSQYFRIIHENVGFTNWHLHYDFELTIDAPLPVEFISFTGKKVQDFVQLDWSTASEFNSDYFEIMRSTNGINFETIGRMNAAGFSNLEKQYTFEDKNPLAGNNYYRLKQIDQDGKICYSNIVILNFEKDLLEIQNTYPNPSRNQISIEYFAYSDKTAFFRIYNMIGQLVQSQKEEINIGENLTAIDLRQLQGGVYLLEIQQGESRQQVRIAKH